MQQRKNGICLLLTLLLATGNMVAVQAAADGTATQVSEATTESAEKREDSAAEQTTTDKAQEAETDSEIETETSEKTEAGERTAVLTVISITGNELTYYEEETEAESETSEDVSSKTETEETTEQVSGQGGLYDSESSESGQEEAASGAQMPSNMPDMSQMPTGTPPDFSQDGTGTAPDFSQSGTGTPPDFSKDGTGSAPDFSQNGSGSAPDMSQMPGGAATRTVYLPVPVVVHTDDGDRTFSILEAGDRLQATIVTDADGNETITELWLLGTGDS